MSGWLTLEGGSRRFYFMVYPCFLWFILPQILLILWLPFCWMLGWFFSAATFSLSQLSSLKRSSYDISIFFGFLVHSMNTCFWSSFWLPHSLHVRSSLNVVLRLVFTGSMLLLVRIIALHCFLLSFTVYLGLCSPFLFSLFSIQCLILVFDMASFFIFWYMFSLLKVSKTLLRPFCWYWDVPQRVYIQLEFLLFFLSSDYFCVWFPSCWVMGLSCYGFCRPVLFSFSLLFFFQWDVSCFGE